MKFHRRSPRTRFAPWTLLYLPVVWVLSMACVLRKRLPKRGQEASESEKTVKKTLFSQLSHWHMPFHLSSLRIVLPRFAHLRRFSSHAHKETSEQSSTSPAPFNESNNISPLKKSLLP
jgi:hypothetical protein